MLLLPYTFIFNTSTFQHMYCFLFSTFVLSILLPFDILTFGVIQDNPLDMSYFCFRLFYLATFLLSTLFRWIVQLPWLQTVQDFFDILTFDIFIFDIFIFGVFTFGYFYFRHFNFRHFYLRSFYLRHYSSESNFLLIVVAYENRDTHSFW